MQCVAVYQLMFCFIDIYSGRSLNCIDNNAFFPPSFGRTKPLATDAADEFLVGFAATAATTIVFHNKGIKENHVGFEAKELSFSNLLSFQMYQLSTTVSFTIPCQTSQ